MNAARTADRPAIGGKICSAFFRRFKDQWAWGVFAVECLRNHYLLFVDRAAAALFSFCLSLCFRRCFSVPRSNGPSSPFIESSRTFVELSSIHIHSLLYSSRSRKRQKRVSILRWFRKTPCNAKYVQWICFIVRGKSKCIYKILLTTDVQN